MDHHIRAPWRTALGALVLVFAALCVQARHPHLQNEGEAGVFDYYVLSLSWAPTYCLTHTDDGAECSGKGYGFVLHGLWPQYESGGYPDRCDSQFQMSAEAASKGTTIYPSERLMQHEWQEHGTCSGLDPEAYFKLVRQAFASVKVPARLAAPNQMSSMTPQQLKEEFVSGNPHLRAENLTVSCGNNYLTGVSVCLTKQLQPTACQALRDCRANSVKIPPVR